MKLVLEDFIKMEDIEHQYFPNENISPAEEAYKWYLKDQNSCITVKENNVVVAYINVLSLKKPIYDKVKYNKLNESEIKVDDLELNKENYFNYLYFSTIAIDKEHRNIILLRKLLKEAQKLLNNILQQHQIIEVMADCSTKEGAKITQRFLKLKPFMQTSHGSTVHILNGEQFVQNLMML